MSAGDNSLVRPIAALVIALLVSSCSSSGDRSRSARGGPVWDTDMGAAKVSKFTEVRIPEGATEVKGAIRVDGMDDVYILSFVTDEEKAVSISEDLNAEKPLRRVKKMASATGDFDQLGLADPDTLDNVRWTGVCPSCVRDKRRKGVLQIDIYVQPRPQGKARVYVRAL